MRIPGLGPENKKARSPKIVHSLGRMYREVEAERRSLTTSMATIACSYQNFNSAVTYIVIRQGNQVS